MTFDQQKPMTSTAGAALFRVPAEMPPPRAHVAPCAQVDPSEILGELIESTRPQIQQLDLFA